MGKKQNKRHISETAEEMLCTIYGATRGRTFLYEGMKLW